MADDCHHLLAAGTCAYAQCGGQGDTLTTTRYCGCRAFTERENVARRRHAHDLGLTPLPDILPPNIKGGRCTRCGHGFPPTTHDGRHGASCRACRQEHAQGIASTRQHGTHNGQHGASCRACTRHATDTWTPPRRRNRPTIRWED